MVGKRPTNQKVQGNSSREQNQQQNTVSLQCPKQRIHPETQSLHVDTEPKPIYYLPTNYIHPVPKEGRDSDLYLGICHRATCLKWNSALQIDVIYVTFDPQTVFTFIFVEHMLLLFFHMIKLCLRHISILLTNISKFNNFPNMI